MNLKKSERYTRECEGRSSSALGQGGSAGCDSDCKHSKYSLSVPGTSVAIRLFAAGINAAALFPKDTGPPFTSVHVHLFSNLRVCCRLERQRMPCTSPIPMSSSGPLLSTVVPSIPKLDKTQRIKSFLDTQRAHSKHYLLEGRALALSLDRHGGELTTPKEINSNPKRDYGFGTPILQPRAKRAACDSSDRHAEKENQRDQTDEQSPCAAPARLKRADSQAIIPSIPKVASEKTGPKSGAPAKKVISKPEATVIPPDVDEARDSRAMKSLLQVVQN